MKFLITIYNDDSLPQDTSPWDRVFEDGDEFMVGSIPVRVMLSPGHTLASVTYVAGDAAFRFIERAVQRVQAMKQGHPLDTSTMVGAR